MRPSLGGLPRGGSGASNPAIGVATGNTQDNNGSTVYAALTLSTLRTGDGFTLSGNALTCLVPGVYELTALFSAWLASGTHDFFVSYCVNGGTDVLLVYGSNVIEQTFNPRAIVKLAAGDQVQLRFKCGSAAENVHVEGAKGNHTQLSLVQLSTFQ